MNNVMALADALFWVGEPQNIVIHNDNTTSIIISDEVVERTAFYTLGDNKFYFEEKGEEGEYIIDEVYDKYYIDMANNIINYINKMDSNESSFYQL